jgi:hypothetical protein
MHSYSGCISTDAAQGLEYTAGSRKGGVTHLVYLRAYMLVPGISVWGVLEKMGVDLGMWGKFMED